MRPDTEDEDLVYSDDADRRLVEAAMASFGGEESTEKAVESFNEAAKPDAPMIQEPGNGLVTLMYGVEVDGMLRDYVEIREMNGRDEEALAKLNPDAPNYPVVIVDTVIRRAVTSLGGLDPKPERLQALLMGDRDLIFKEILISTYGSEKEYDGIECQSCKERMDLHVDVAGVIEVQKLEGEPEFTVKLKDGTEVRMHYPTGKNQMAVYSGTEVLSLAETNTLMLAQCIDEVDGRKINNGRKFALDLSIRDRATLVDALAKGPSVRFKEVEVPCEHCGTKLPFVLGWADLLQL